MRKDGYTIMITLILILSAISFASMITCIYHLAHFAKNLNIILKWDKRVIRHEAESYIALAVIFGIVGALLAFLNIFISWRLIL